VLVRGLVDPLIYLVCSPLTCRGGQKFELPFHLFPLRVLGVPGLFSLRVFSFLVPNIKNPLAHRAELQSQLPPNLNIYYLFRFPYGLTRASGATRRCYTEDTSGEINFVIMGQICSFGLKGIGILIGHREWSCMLS